MIMNVWLVISSYRNDAEVVALLDRVRPLVPGFFAHVLIVDSTGTGAIPELLESGAWSHITYSSYDCNLGSGANLCERLRIAAEAGADYAYAVNHDGNVDPDVVSALLKVAGSSENLGAVYPLGLMTNARLYNMTGTRELPLPAKFVSTPPSTRLLDVFWSSSNGALYSLKPARQGLLPWHAMWMGWEDLEYGWRLKDHGYRQVMVSRAIYRDDHEYVETWVGTTVDKPAWRTYYCFRNLLFAIRRSRNRPLYYAVVTYRMAIECLLIFLVRDSKWKRLREVAAGVVDGLMSSPDGNSESWRERTPKAISG